MKKLHLNYSQKNFKVFYFLENGDYIAKSEIAKKVKIDPTSVTRLERCFNKDKLCAYELYKLLRKFYFDFKSKLNEDEFKKLIFEIPEEDFSYIIKLYASDYISPRYFKERKLKFKNIIKKYHDIIKKIIPDIEQKIKNLFKYSKNRKTSIQKKEMKKAVENTMKIVAEKINEKNQKDLKFINKKFKPKKVNIISFGLEKSETISKLKKYYEKKYKKELKNA